MNIHVTPMDEHDDAFDIERAREALRALKPNAQQQKQARFADLLPEIKAAVERRVPVKQILATLETLGLKLSPAGFKKLYEDVSGDSSGDDSSSSSVTI
ncbi:hypothetical protein PQQ51_23020 [Paraburkholderia xenovorans]|uniref:hypothetical protein n=1 Tax=Paraburkholderia xenovorans TaxID=36873 RepID=UPI0038BA86E4